MLSSVFHRGPWNNFTEMEDNLTLDELYLLINSLHEEEHRRNKFAAALKGVDLDEVSGEGNADFDKVKMRVEAELAGKSEQEYVFEMIGIEVEDDD